MNCAGLAAGYVAGALDYGTPRPLIVHSVIKGAAPRTRSLKVERRNGAAERGGVEGFGARRPRPSYTGACLC